jgi:hypothetical protein
MTEPTNTNVAHDTQELTMSKQPATQADIANVRSDISTLNNTITRLLDVVDAAAILEAARKAKEAEASHKLAKAIADENSDITYG